MKRTIVLLSLFACMLLVGCSSEASTPSSAAPDLPTPHTSNTLNSTAPTAPAFSGGSPILGSDLSAFTSKYGNPNSHSNAKDGSYHYQTYSDSNIDFLILQTDVTDAGYSQKVEWVTASASDGGSGWTSQQVSAKCNPFFPSDAVYKSQVPLSDGGTDKIYYSASLASMFPADAFSDANTDQIQAGMFDAEYLPQAGQGSNIGSCSIMIGTQQTSD